MANATVIILTLLTHVAIISTGGISQFNVNGHVFYSDFYLMGGGGSIIINGKLYTLNLPLEYTQGVLKNATLNLISLIDYLKKNDPLLTSGDVRILDNTRSILASMLQSNTFETSTLAQSEDTVVNIYYQTLSKMRSDKYELLEQIKAYLSMLDSPGIPPKLQDSAEELRAQLRKTYSLLERYDYGISYFYTQLYPNAQELIKKAEFIATYPQVYEELTVVKNIYSYLDSEGLLNDKLKEMWLDKFSPMYVKFIRGLYVTPNVTVMEQTLINYLNTLKDEAEQNLLKAKAKTDSYTDPPFYQKGEYEKEIAELQEELSTLNFKKFNNATFENVKKLVEIYKKSKSLPDEIGHKYILDVIGTIVVMGAVVGILLARLGV